MKFLVTRYVTAEQRKRDDYNITEDDVMEIRQDISKLRYDLIDILHKNGMKTPKVSKQENLAGKKGKVMERRLLKDFHIGIVEGMVNELMTATKDHKDVFAHLAKVLGKRASKQNKQKNWNDLVRKSTYRGDPIGTAQEAETTRIKRQSLRKHILSTVAVPINIDHDKLIGTQNENL